MLNIIFVDDDPNLLSSLQRMSHTKRDEWETAFAGSGAEALELMQKRHFDVIVADMRMPSMDGADLLKKVAELYPDTLRFILSGHSDKDLILKAIRWTHQFLAKPCDFQSLHDKIHASLALSKALDNPQLHKRLSSIKNLPALPQSYERLCAELDSDEGTIKSAAKIISEDISLTSKILQIVNSAFFALPRHIESLEQAVSLLGLETIRTLTLVSGIFKDTKDAQIGALSVQSLFVHSARVGSIAKLVAKELGLEREAVEDAFFAGTLHDVGKLVLLHEYPKELKAIQELVANEGLSTVDAEYACLGVSHGLMGAYLLAIWGLPHSIIEAVAFHHEPLECFRGSINIASVIYIAEALAQVKQNTDYPVFASHLDMNYIKRMGIETKLETLFHNCSIATENQESLR